MKNITLMSEILTDYNSDENADKRAFIEKASDKLNQIEIEAEELAQEIFDLKYDKNQLENDIIDKEKEIDEKDNEICELQNISENDFIKQATNLNEVDKMEIIKRLYENLTVAQLQKLEEEAKTMFSNLVKYNMHVI